MSGEPDDDQPLTVLLQRIRDGDRTAEDDFVPLVYNRLRLMARRQLGGERANHSLRPTALVGELYLRIIRGGAIDWRGRTHFFAVAAQTIRRILVDHARHAGAQRRPPARARVELEDVVASSGDHPSDMLLVNELLTELQARDPRQAQLVELKLFTGLSTVEAAEQLGISESTAKRDWNVARAWMSSKLNPPPGDGPAMPR